MQFWKFQVVLICHLQHAHSAMLRHKLYIYQRGTFLCFLELWKAWFLSEENMYGYLWDGGGWVDLIEKRGISWKKEKDEEVFWPLVAFTAQAQIIEGHGNLSDRWTMLPFSSPLWTGPSIMGGEINSIHQLFVSLGPLMPPYIAGGGAYKCLWTWSESTCLTMS